jgi:hypothetical protein
MSFRKAFPLAALGIGPASLFTGWLVWKWGGPSVTHVIDDIGLVWFPLYAACDEIDVVVADGCAPTVVDQQPLSVRGIGGDALRPLSCQQY